MSYTFKLWYPTTVAFTAATASLSIKAPEIGDKTRAARNQSFVRTRGGTPIWHDRGRDYDQQYTIQFRSVRNNEKAALEVFLDAVQWGMTRLKMLKHDGTERIVRIKSTQLEYIDTGFSTHNNPAVSNTLWDFDLDILDITNNDDALESSELPLSSPLSLHLSDYNHPHNPQVSTTVNIADGAKVIEGLSADSWRNVTWICDVRNGTSCQQVIVSGIHNGTSSLDATSVDYSVQYDVGLGTLGKITFSVDLNGAGTSQVIRLKAAASTNGWTVSCRRVKLA